MQLINGDSTCFMHAALGLMFNNIPLRQQLCALDLEQVPEESRKVHVTAYGVLKVIQRAFRGEKVNLLAENFG